MKTLIIYSSKKGATQKCAEQIKKGVAGEVKIVSFKESPDIDIRDFDNIVMGSPVYAGMLDNGLKNFCKNNQELLKSKKVFLFLGCMNDSGLTDYVKNNLPEEIANNLVDVTCCGGAFYFSKMNFFEKFIIKKIASSEAKAKGETQKIDGKTDMERFKENNINELINKINKG